MVAVPEARRKMQNKVWCTCVIWKLLLGRAPLHNKVGSHSQEVLEPGTSMDYIIICYHMIHMEQLELIRMFYLRKDKAIFIQFVDLLYYQNEMRESNMEVFWCDGQTWPPHGRNPFPLYILLLPTYCQHWHNCIQMWESVLHPMSVYIFSDSWLLMAEMMNNDVQTLDCFVNISFISERLRRLKDLLRQRCEGVVVHVWE